MTPEFDAERLGKKLKQNVPGMASDADFVFAQLAGLLRQSDETTIVQGMITYNELDGIHQQSCC